LVLSSHRVVSFSYLPSSFGGVGLGGRWSLKRSGLFITVST
jgi:hypothetical protein